MQRDAVIAKQGATALSLGFQLAVVDDCPLVAGFGPMLAFPDADLHTT